MKSKKSIDLENKTKDSDAIYIARGIAILSVIAAHVNILDKTTAYSTLVTSGIMYFGQIGVVIFFLTGGFLYHREDHDTYIYFKRKLHTLILPWIVCSAITYIISAALSREISLLSYLRWGFGSGSWYYYITVYIVCLFLFKWIWERDAFLIFCVLMTGISLYFGENFFSMIGYKGFIITPYLNILNWMGFFALGILIRRKFASLKMRAQPLILAAFIAIFGCAGLCRHEIYTYFSLNSYFFEVGGSIVLISLSYYINKKYFIGQVLLYSGKNSFFIYLLHMQIVQFICSRIPYNVIWDIVRPVIGLLVMDCLIWVFNLLNAKFSIVKKMLPWFGLRREYHPEIRGSR